jgi:hypothetical protein
MQQLFIFLRHGAMQIYQIWLFSSQILKRDLNNLTKLR